MFANGLKDIVTIIPMTHNLSARTVKDQAKNDTAQQTENVPCRIVADEIAYFMPDVTVKIGDVIQNPTTNKNYTVKEVKAADGLTSKHHQIVKIEIKKV